MPGGDIVALRLHKIAVSLINCYVPLKCENCDLELSLCLFCHHTMNRYGRAHTSLQLEVTLTLNQGDSVTKSRSPLRNDYAHLNRDGYAIKLPLCLIYHNIMKMYVGAEA